MPTKKLERHSVEVDPFDIPARGYRAGFLRYLSQHVIESRTITTSAMAHLWRARRVDALLRAAPAAALRSKDPAHVVLKRYRLWPDD